MGRLDGWLDPIGNATVTEALRRIEQELFDADWQQAKAEHGDTVTADRLWRTPAQRRADALVEMAHRAATAPADGKRPGPLVIVHTDAGTFALVDRTSGNAAFHGTRCDLVFGSNLQLRDIAEHFAADDGNERFISVFVDAWTKVMMADRFDVS